MKDAVTFLASANSAEKTFPREIYATRELLDLIGRIGEVGASDQRQRLPHRSDALTLSAGSHRSVGSINPSKNP